MKGTIKSKNSKGWGQAQIGTSSLVLIFTVLALVIFSTLSLSSARVDQRLAEKTAQHVDAYYKADGLGEETLRDINRRLEESEMFSGTNGEYLERIRFLYEDKVDTAGGILTYRIPMGGGSAPFSGAETAAPGNSPADRQELYHSEMGGSEQPGI